MCELFYGNGKGQKFYCFYFSGKSTNIFDINKIHQEFQASRNKYTLNRIDIHIIGAQIFGQLYSVLEVLVRSTIVD